MTTESFETINLLLIKKNLLSHSVSCGRRYQELFNQKIASLRIISEHTIGMLERSVPMAKINQDEGVG